ncbi:hypothetical protein [Glutamicibacter sp.]|uniref:hypothetical protein n=1 Tax=Glutamicibacter sp. TaxID=1931995 RepID=UPI002FE4017A
MHNQPNRGALTLWAMRQQPAGHREIGIDATARLLIALAELSQNGITVTSGVSLGEYAGGLSYRSVTAGLRSLEDQGLISREGRQGRFVRYGFPNGPKQDKPHYIDANKTDVQNDVFDWALKQRPKTEALQSRNLAGRALTALAAHADYDGYASVSLEELSQYVGMIQRQALRDCVQTLQDTGLITQVDTSNGRAWTFRPVWQDALRQPPSQA